jgi:hypothetical protein
VICRAYCSCCADIDTTELFRPRGHKLELAMVPGDAHFA